MPHSQKKSKNTDLIQSRSDIFYNIDTFLTTAISLTKQLQSIHSKYPFLGTIHISPLLLDSDTKLVGDLLRCKSDQSIPDCYQAPEQTTHTHSTPDFRTDIYQLGILFYELLSQSTPKKLSSQVLDLNFDINQTIPHSIRLIIQKMVHRFQDNRYQSHDGLINDLVRCQQDLKNTGQISHFFPGLSDRVTTLKIGDYLYGRDPETTLFCEQFNQRLSNQSEFTLVTGPSGIGKTTFVKKSLDQILSDTDPIWVSSGKFNKTINRPFEAILQIIDQLITLINNDTSSAISWRTVLNKALYPFGKLLVDQVPSLGPLLGPQIELDPSLNHQPNQHIQHLFISFFKSILNQQRPMIICLDDLQWADSESLLLIQELLKSASSNAWLIGTARSEDCGPSHPVTQMMDRLINPIIPDTVDEFLKSANQQHPLPNVVKITLSELSENTVSELIHDTLKTAQCTQDLSKLIFSKTHGNPFYIQQLIQSYLDQELLFLHEGDWTWDLTKMTHHHITDNVAEITITRFKELPQRCQTLLSQCACFGHSFNSSDIAACFETDTTDVDLNLQISAQKGFISQKLPGHYHFLHDKIQAAAYQSLRPDQTDDIHQQIIDFLCKRNTQSTRNEPSCLELFNTANHALQLSQKAQTHQRLLIIQILCDAGTQALKSMAMDKASTYFEAIQPLHQESDWKSHYHLSLQYITGLSKVRYYQGDHAFALESLTQAKLHHTSPYYKALINHTIQELYTSSGHYDEAVNIGLSALNYCGVSLSKNPSTVKMIFRVIQAKFKLSKDSSDTIETLPDLQNKDALLSLQILSSLIPSAHVLNLECLSGLIPVTMLTLTFKYGHSAYSPYTFGVMALMMNAAFESYQWGYQLSQQAMLLSHKISQNSMHPRLLQVICTNYGFFKPFSDVLSIANQSLNQCLSNGDIIYASFAMFHVIRIQYLMGLSLNQQHQFFLNQADTLQEFEGLDIYQSIRTIHCLIRSLKSPSTSTPHILTHEDAIIRNGNSLNIFGYYTIKMKYHLIMNEPDLALAAGLAAKPHIRTGKIFAFVADYYLLLGLSYASNLSQKTTLTRWSSLRKIKQIEKKLHQFQQFCPKNFRHKYLFIRAELATLTLKPDQVRLKFQDAIDCAIDDGFTHYAALASERAAHYYQSVNNDKQMNASLHLSLELYEQWGATQKVNQLRTLYPELSQTSSTTSIKS